MRSGDLWVFLEELGEVRCGEACSGSGSPVVEGFFIGALHHASCTRGTCFVLGRVGPTLSRGWTYPGTFVPIVLPILVLSCASSRGV